MSKFTTTVASKIKGASPDVAAAQQEKKAKAALTSQIAQLESKKVDDEMKVSDAQDALEAARYPVNISNSSTYLNSILSAQSSLDAAKDVLTRTSDTIAYWKAELAEISA